MAAYRRVYDSHHLQADCQNRDQLRNATLGNRAGYAGYFLVCRDGRQQAKSLDASVWCTDHARVARSSVDVQCFRCHRRHDKQRLGNATGRLQRQSALYSFLLFKPATKSKKRPKLHSVVGWTVPRCVVGYTTVCTQMWAVLEFIFSQG